MSKALNADDELDKYLFVTWNMKDTVINRAMADGIKKWLKKHELQARIDEINYLDDNFQADSQDWEREHPGYSTAMIPMEDYIRRRAELKAQQEELGDS